MKKLMTLILALAMITSLFVYIIPTNAASTSTEGLPDSSEIFKDVEAGSWYQSAVDYVVAHGIMGGAGSNDTFKPQDLSTRAMIAVILHRLEGTPAANGTSPFTDLTQDWYTPAVEWAYENGVVNGSSATTFNPDGNITRQEIVTMLFRYISYKALDVSGRADFDGFTDGDSVAPWAKDAVAWGVDAGLINGRASGDSVSLAPAGNTQRNEMATIFRRLCESYGLFDVKDDDTGNNFMKAEDMTLEDVLADIQSERVKKVIFDADAGNEIDDQYALAYALSIKKLDVLSINASQFENKALVPDRNAGMMEGYNEIKRVLKLLGREDIPVYKGVGTSVTKPDDSGIGYPTVTPVNAEAVENIINTAKNSDEIIYIMTTGCATNIACALAKDPSIKDKICVVWLGANFYDSGAGEFNFGQDRTAGRYMMNSGVRLVWLPAISNDSTKGTQSLKTDRAFIENSFTNDNEASRYFGGGLALEHDGSYDTNAAGWRHTFWDVAAPALFDTPELCEFEIIKLWRIRGDDTWDSNTKDRPRCIILNKIKDPAQVLNNMATGINSLIH